MSENDFATYNKNAPSSSPPASRVPTQLEEINLVERRRRQDAEHKKVMKEVNKILNDFNGNCVFGGDTWDDKDDIIDIVKTLTDRVDELYNENEEKDSQYAELEDENEEKDAFIIKLKSENETHRLKNVEQEHYIRKEFNENLLSKKNKELKEEIIKQKDINAEACLHGSEKIIGLKLALKTAYSVIKFYEEEGEK